MAERVLGPEDPDTLRIRASLADFTGRAGDAASARDQYAALLSVEERALPPEGLYTGILNVRRLLAFWTGEAGDLAAAQDQLTTLLPVAERVLGLEHPDTLQVRASLADFTGEGGEPGRRQGPVRCSVARKRAGPRPRTPGHPDHPA